MGLGTLAFLFLFAGGSPAWAWAQRLKKNRDTLQQSPTCHDGQPAHGVTRSWGYFAARGANDGSTEATSELSELVRRSPQDFATQTNYRPRMLLIGGVYLTRRSGPQSPNQW